MSHSAPGPTAPRPGPPVTAESSAAAALEQLDTLTDRPLGEHVAVFTAVHDALAGRLSAAEN
ncbi:hypothetical protein V2J52_00025 [Georgenia sp. MJ173]|uniref:hypothetical protein n=1 Tax=Georgenia sunbinii TaxID=3117728 RepID=UPI002F25F1DC